MIYSLFSVFIKILVAVFSINVSVSMFFKGVWHRDKTKTLISFQLRFSGYVFQAVFPELRWRGLVV